MTLHRLTMLDLGPENLYTSVRNYAEYDGIVRIAFKRLVSTVRQKNVFFTHLPQKCEILKNTRFRHLHLDKIAKNFGEVRVFWC